MLRTGWCRTAVLVMLGLPLAARTAAAQIDYRNLDDERPVVTEDAYPIERYAFELLVPYRYESEASGEQLHASILELGYGLLPNTQVGVHFPLAAVRAAGDTEWGLAGIQPFALYNFNTETRRLPALSFRGDLSLPVGALGGEGIRFTLRALATRSWGLTRLHLNAARSFGPEEALSAAEPAPRWSYSLATDRTVLRSSLLLVGEIVIAREVREAPVEVNAGIGARLQWTPTLVLDAGLTRRLRDEGPDIGLTVGLSHAFALRGLLPDAGR